MSEPLARWLADLRLRHAFLVVGRFAGTAGVRIEPEGVAAFHYCLAGSCFIEAEGGATMRLEDGDFLFMREGLRRVVWSGTSKGPSTPVALTSLIPPVQRDAAVNFSIRGGTGAREHVVLGGGFCITSPEARLFVHALPPLFRVRRGAPFSARLRLIIDELVAEATTGAPGASPVVARLAEVAVLIGVRSFAASQDEACALLEAARDPRLARALEAIHREPEGPWTIAELGRVAGMSRSGFAAEFMRSVGETPAAYVTQVRMARAERLLLEHDWSLPRIAEAVGYASPAAFSVAFKRLRGVSPGSVRPSGDESAPRARRPHRARSSS
jgi:AraC-like DNA-binding protein